MSEDQVYEYRGVDSNGSSAYGKLLANSQEQAEHRVKSMGIRVEFVGLDGKPPPRAVIEQARAMAQEKPEEAKPAFQKPPPPSEARGIPPELKKYAEDPSLAPPPPPPPPQRQPQAETLRVLTSKDPLPAPSRRESLLYGEHQQIKDRLELLLEKHGGRVRQVHMVNGVTGRQVLAVVVEHDRIQ